MGRGHIGTEHLLLGLIHEEDGIAARALMDLGLSLEAVRDRIKETDGRTTGELTDYAPFTPRAKKVLELSLREALERGDFSIGTEHLLLGLVREGEGVAAQVLHGLGVDLPRVRLSVVHYLPGYQRRPSVETQVTRSDSSEAPRCADCTTQLALVMRYGSMNIPTEFGLLRYRSMTVPPPSPNSFPLTVDAVYCNRCGTAVAMLRAESPS